MSVLSLGFTLLGTAATGAAFAGMAWIAYLGSLKVDPEAPFTVRLCAIAVGIYGLCVAIFWCLMPLYAFRTPIVLLGIGLLAFLVTRWHGAPRGAAQKLAQETAALSTRIKQASSWKTLCPVALLAAVVLPILIRGLYTPPLGWDSLTYHLLKAGRWVQFGGHIAEAAPDAWSYYEYFPLTGDIFSAWAMLGVRGDGLLSVLGGAIWLSGLLAVYASARQLGAGRNPSLLAAMAFSALPSILGQVTSGYVDNTTNALFALAAVFVIRLLQSGPVVQAIWAIAALSMMLGVKTTTAPVFLLGIGVVVVFLIRRRADSSRRLVAACLLAALLGSPAYFRTWFQKGSPVYPWAVTIGSKTLFAGDAGAQEVGQNMLQGLRLDSPSSAYRRLFFQRSKNGSFIAPGPGALPLMILGILGGILLAWRPATRHPALFLLICAALILGLWFSGSLSLARETIKVRTMGRYFGPGFAALAVLGVGLRGRWAQAAWVLSLLGSAIYAFPRGWHVAEKTPFVLTTMALTLLILGAWFSVKVRQRYGPLLFIPLLIGFLSFTQALASHYRYPLYAAAADRKPLFHMHPLHPVYAGAWDLWRLLDRGQAATLAVTAGWDGLGHNWYRYPFLGSRLQNEVLYVPITRDGKTVPYRQMDLATEAASLAAWLGRLMEVEVDYIVSLAPRNTIEDRWLSGHPEFFEPIYRHPRGFHAAYRLRRQSIEDRFRSQARINSQS